MFFVLAKYTAVSFTSFTEINGIFWHLSNWNITDLLVAIRVLISWYLVAPVSINWNSRVDVCPDLPGNGYHRQKHCLQFRKPRHRLCHLIFTDFIIRLLLVDKIIRDLIVWYLVAPAFINWNIRMDIGWIYLTIATIDRSIVLKFWKHQGGLLHSILHWLHLAFLDHWHDQGPDSLVSGGPVFINWKIIGMDVYSWIFIRGVLIFVTALNDIFLHFWGVNRLQR